MNGKRIGVTLLIIVVVVIAGIVVLGHRSKTTDDKTVTTSTTPRTTDAPAAGETSKSAVTMQDLAFAPATVTVKKGTTVVWTNQDSVKHDVTSDTDSPMGGLALPLIGKGEQASFTFNDVGTYKYHCTPHPFMHGTVIVTE